MDNTQVETKDFLRVKDIRLAKGMTVQELASKAGISYNTMLAYERDNATMVRKDVLTRLAAALGVTVPDLFK